MANELLWLRLCRNKAISKVRLSGSVHLQCRQLGAPEPQQALEKLLDLAMAIGNDLERFECPTRRGEA